MTITIKSRNFSPTKTENTWEKDGVGWAPGSEKKFDGVVSNSIRYGKNFSFMKGTCKKCENKTDKKGTNGEHCALPRNEGCIF